MGETSKRSDVLLNSISIASCIIFNSTLCTCTNTIDLVVDLCSGVITKLTSTGTSPLDGSWMPSSDTSNLSKTSVSLSGKFLDTESLYDTLDSFTTSNTDCINTFVSIENLTKFNFLLEMIVGVLDFISDFTTIKLNFHDVSLVLAELKKTDLGGNEDTDNGTVLFDTFEITVDGAGALGIFLESISILGESLLLGISPVSVETTLNISIKLLSKNGR